MGSVCPGEGPRYGDYKCIHDRTHRVCAKLVEDKDTCNEVRWSGSSFWDITGQGRWNWKRSVCGGPNPGDSWCICMWATANLVAEVGCDNMDINCAATDVDYVLRSRYDGGWNLSNFNMSQRKMREAIRWKIQEQELEREAKPTSLRFNQLYTDLTSVNRDK